jgi:glycosyltransferase involved in cell wall biosynthesis
MWSAAIMNRNHVAAIFPPVVSLLVAMRNESGHIEGCIRSIFGQDYPHEKIEVFILDGQSDDDSKKIVAEMIACKKNYYLLENSKRIQSAAWNLGFQLSRGDVVSIVSAHSRFASDYVSKAVETLLRTKADMVGGTVRAENSGYIGETIALAVSTPFGVGNANFRYTDDEEETDTVFMGFCWRTTYEKLGGFDEELARNQDDEFSYRLRKTGGRIVCNPGIVSYYKNRATLRSLWSQYYQYGYWKVRVLQKHPRQMSLRQFAPPAFVLGILGSGLLAFSPVFRPLCVVLPLLYLAANLIASVITSARKGWKYLLPLPLVFCILHISYGLGFLAGLMKFWNRWNDKVGKTPLWSGKSIG